ncbi:2-C-methyl-D-erythritol 4-phosphate cytidylyltransferase [Solibaculum mannosilyticum]|uniref:2-C-methyl-D-erythritol 4-phosphate cytidylyltransferase n=1 Tax=Solibaculum mannosilyticum TaxID=2780922 RepID=A0A7I8D622_9FIRM|nr:2-C-methyl-D-erythritol 4-phosphate cytidylyltransferase [Solibaculum mannosilyticum]BCI60114.1 2-C-methyl-D-erythritol 4-phosphate cytidylyltransferase [Solibaculum mannosilyticum]
MKETFPFVTAIVVAAGGSTRMGGEVSKQLLPIAGMPVIGRTLSAFEAAGCIDDVVVVAREEDLLDIYDIIRSFGFEKVSQVVRGGATRQQSVAMGVQNARPETTHLAIHDGARPLVSVQVIGDVVACALEHRAAATGVRVKDTLKQVSDAGVIEYTPDRSHLWMVHTPQVFEKRLYQRAMDAAQEAREDFTDDCQLVERMGGIPVHMYEGSYENIKITTPEDLPIAEALLLRRQQEGDL